MTPVAGTHYLAGPVIAFAVIAGLALFLRWAFRGEPRRRPAADDGLLTRVATLSGRESALALRAVLSDAGIRSTVRATGAHRAEVLVFPEDADRARVLASSFPAG
ncbi:hypothetical protein [Geodermatophilus obscurus]|uniref:DUF2007 domain-containing protein n=1 Tax=Geodermatophilus obscurus (strain ATCC 25078 / DSM 43160 / JCM 3152 / CCUG 61914 / KCC A-0152 / KCTC 9177 / NBRC 13315 / NRRL B-3577 / G-20) TaxID=526225 RepID=D2SEQ6_GEOOG|nr:hypothetical protein [Geodermatophilus obscurus]ADB76692.1 conserved hypothetical protein [Geodermatophilus obscurus DSM 43160]